MRMKFFTIPVFDTAAAELEVNRFVAQHRVLSVDRRLVEAGDSSAWTVCVTYVDPAQVRSEAPASTSTKKSKIDYKEVLSEADFAVYSRLRDLRKKLAEEAGIPAYSVFTNDQLAAIVTQRVNTKAALSRIDGVGEAKVAKYGDIFLEAVGARKPEPRTNGAAHAAS